jgi:hypothetical protein
VRVTVKFRQERRTPRNIDDVNRAVGVRLLSLTVKGRRLRSADFSRASGIFSSFAWVERFAASCYRGSVALAVNGMPHEGFVRSVREREPLPPFRTRTIRLSARGVEDTS